MNRIYLDDKRIPEDSVHLHGSQYKEQWRIVRSKTQFIEQIKKEMPEVISFDHDLKPAHYSFDYSDRETGYDCLVWLLDYCDNTRIEPPKIFIHSMSPKGKERMQNYITGWQIGRNII